MKNQIKLLNRGITEIPADAVVNAANEGLWEGGGVCGAVFQKAGSKELTKACQAIGHCDTGNAVMTPAFYLNAKYIVHAVGPRYRDGKSGEAKLLYSAYRNALLLAGQYACHSIVFPLLSAGIFGYPQKEAWRLALKACLDFLEEYDDYRMTVYFAIPDPSVLEMGKTLLEQLKDPKVRATIRTEEKEATEKEKAMQGYLFRQGDPELAQRRKEAKDLCFRFNHTLPSLEEERKEILDQLIGHAKGSYTITAPFYCDYGSYITLGERFFCNYNCKILDGAEVVFGDDVRIAPDCSFLTPNHSPDPELRKNGWQIFQPVHVGNNVWFGAGVTVLPGVTIGDNSIIAAGSVVAEDIPANVIAMGVPAKVKRALTPEDKQKYPMTEEDLKKCGM